MAEPDKNGFLKFFSLEASPTVQIIKQIMASLNQPHSVNPDPKRPASPPSLNLARGELDNSLQNLPPQANRTEPESTIPIQSVQSVNPEFVNPGSVNPGGDSPADLMTPTSNGRAAMPAGLQTGLQTEQGNFDWQWLASIAPRLHQAETIEVLFQVAITELKQRLQADRILIYQFQTDDQGVVRAEVLTRGYTPSLGERLPAIAFGADTAQMYQQQIVAFSDASRCSFMPYQQQLMEQFQVQASLSVPILMGQMWGLLVVQQCTNPRQWLDNEVSLLYQLVNELKLSLQRLTFYSERQVLTQISDKIHQSFDNAAQVKQACQTAIQEVRRLLNVERVCIYKFRPDYFGDFIYESESGGWNSLVGSAWEDTYLQEHKGGRFHNNEPFVVNDIYTGGLSDCHVKALEHFGVKAFAVVAIKQGDKLWGLLSAFQHSGPWHWAESDVALLMDVGRQLGTALQGADYLTQLQEQSNQMAKAAQISHSVAEIIPRIFQAQDLDSIFRVASQSTRLLLKCDRVAIYRFQPDPLKQNSAPISQRVVESAGRGLSVLDDSELGALGYLTNRRC